MSEPTIRTVDDPNVHEVVINRIMGIGATGTENHLTLGVVRRVISPGGNPELIEVVRSRLVMADGAVQALRDLLDQHLRSKGATQEKPRPNMN